MKTPMQELIDEMQKSPLMFASALTLVEKMRMLEKEKEMLAGVWLDAQVAYQGDEYIKPSDPTFDEYYEETFNTKEK